MTRNPTGLFCRLLAASAWIAALAFFGVAIVASWGFLPGAMLIWSVAALPLGALTRRWLASAHAPVGMQVQRCILRVCQALGIGLVLLYGVMLVPPREAVGERLMWWIYFPLAVPYGVFPLVVTGWVLWRVARLSEQIPSAPVG